MHIVDDTQSTLLIMFE